MPNTIVNLEDLTLGVNEIAERLGVKPSTAQRYFRLGKIAAYKRGVTYKCTEEDYTAFLKTLRVVRAAPAQG